MEKSDRSKAGLKSGHLEKGQMVLYENEEAEIIRVEPLFIIKTKDRVVCGALHKQLECV